MPEPPPPTAVDTHPSPSNRHQVTLPMDPLVPCCWLEKSKHAAGTPSCHLLPISLSCRWAATGLHLLPPVEDIPQLYCCVDELGSPWTAESGFELTLLTPRWKAPDPQSPHCPLSCFPFLYSLRLFSPHRWEPVWELLQCCVISWLRSQKYG